MRLDKLTIKNFVSEGESFYMADLSLTGEMKNAIHTHDFYEFFVVLQGQFYENCNGKTNLIKQKQLHILKPDDSHEFKAGREDEVNILRNIAVRKSVFEETVNRLNLSPENLSGYYILDGSVFESFFKKTNLLYGPYPEGKQFNFIINNVFEELLIFSVLNQNKNTIIPPWLTKAYQAMTLEENYSAGLPRLFELAGKSPEHVNRSFRQYYATTPTRYINVIRLHNAALMLQTSQDKVIDIIYRCGYTSISYFNRIFKKHYGLSPQEYRKHKNLLFKSI